MWKLAVPIFRNSLKGRLNYHTFCRLLDKLHYLDLLSQDLHNSILCRSNTTSESFRVFHPFRRNFSYQRWRHNWGWRYSCSYCGFRLPWEWYRRGQGCLQVRITIWEFKSYLWFNRSNELQKISRVLSYRESWFCNDYD